jgi:Ca2+-binding EF-hand superfamily protein
MRTILSSLLLSGFIVAANAGDMKAASFKDLDANADGKLSAGEVASLSELKRNFRTADNNADGYLSEAEYQTWASSHRPADKPTGG